MTIEEQREQIRKEVFELHQKINAMPCPDCGEIHHARVRFLPDWTISRVFIDNTCFGYQRFVIDETEKIKAEYSLK